jgi:hypothetical protein
VSLTVSHFVPTFRMFPPFPARVIPLDVVGPRYASRQVTRGVSARRRAKVDNVLISSGAGPVSRRPVGQMLSRCLSGSLFYG